MHAGNNEHDKYYFVADEVIFYVTHPDLDEQGIQDQLVPALKKFLSAGENLSEDDERYWRRSLEFREPDSKITTFSFSTRCPDLEPFSLISLKFKVGKHAAKDLSPDDVLNLLRAAYTELGNRLGNDSPKEGEEVGEARTGVPLDETKKRILLRSIAPNSLSRSLDHGKGIPGPGSIPARKNPPNEAQRNFELRGQREPNPYPIPLADFRMPGAEIAILDTAMPLDNFAAFPAPIPQIFDASKVEVIPYPHSDLAIDDDPLKSTLYDYTKPHSHDGSVDHHHHYDVSDHGTFIVSLIRMLTPKTKIYLHQVLNHHGVGNFMTIAQGVKNAIQRSGEHATPLIINCSFMLEHKMPSKWVPPDPTHTDEALFEPMRVVFEGAATCQNVVVVAAAGNDREPERADPHYPAAFENVLSVAALPKGNTRDLEDPNLPYVTAKYSNRARAVDSSKDKALSFAIFGGDIIANSPAPTGGAVGVYIGKIPTVNPDGTFNNEGELNDSGWAEWSGTSFSAPLIAGLLAAQDDELVYSNPYMQRSQPVDPDRPYRTDQDEDPAKDYDENVILIRQG